MTQTKKDFTAAAAGVFVDKMTAPTAPAPATRQAPKPAPKKTRTNAGGTEVKITCMLDATIERKLRYMAFTERSKQKTIINDALRLYIEDYERVNGKIR